MGVWCTLSFSDLDLGLQRRHVAYLYLEILDYGIMMLYSRAVYRPTWKLGSVQIYYSAYNKAAGLEKNEKFDWSLMQLITVTIHSRQSDGNCFHEAQHMKLG